MENTGADGWQGADMLITSFLMNPIRHCRN